MPEVIENPPMSRERKPEGIQPGKRQCLGAQSIKGIRIIDKFRKTEISWLTSKIMVFAMLVTFGLKTWRRKNKHRLYVRHALVSPE